MGLWPFGRRATEDKNVERLLEEANAASPTGTFTMPVEDAPQLPDDWETDHVPLSSLIRGSGTTPTRLVLFRRPIEHRAETRADLEALVLTVVVEQVAELLGIDPDKVDPRYEGEL